MIFLIYGQPKGWSLSPTLNISYAILASELTADAHAHTVAGLSRCFVAGCRLSLGKMPAIVHSAVDIHTGCDIVVQTGFNTISKAPSLIVIRPMSVGVALFVSDVGHTDFTTGIPAELFRYGAEYRKPAVMVPVSASTLLATNSSVSG